MSTMKQVGLLAAGCQPWNVDVCAASGDRFAYCATLAIYIYQLDHQYNEFKLLSIMSEHKKTITAISWSSHNPDLLASASADNIVIIWSVGEQTVTACLENTRGSPVSIGWSPHDRDVVAYVNGRGPLFLWNHSNHQDGVSVHKDAQNFSSEVCQFRWHPKKMGKVAFGHSDGSISYFCPGQKAQKHVFCPESLDSSDEEDPVAALEWDPLSVEYLLMANTHNGVKLLDTDSHSVIMTFQLPSAASQVHSLAWISTAPGMFLTGDTHAGVMRLWNVSKSSPIENIRLKKTGFHALHVFSTTLTKSDRLSPTRSQSLSSTSEALPSISPTSRYALPPAHAVCTFLDGGVGLYDLGKRKWNFLREQGHIETIFDCKFHPENPSLLATGSFDGTIKIWDINTLSAVHASPGNEGVIYSLSWAPADLNCIAASTSRQGAFIWDISKGKIIKRFTEHGKGSVYSAAWNQKDSRRIATCGGDGYCIVRQVDGKLLIKYKHPGAVFGCDWSPNNKDMIATGCEDKCVRVYYLATTTDQPLKVFTGHTAKVFHVRWSPLRDGILCSGSDDSTIRVWDYTQDACIMVLNGHTAPVRGLLWSTEIPYLLISGSWDYSIRIWDTRDGACIDTVLDHGADVYGLTSHPSRPFVLASCSRDSTVRIWSLTPLVQPLEMNIIAGRPWTEIITSPDDPINDKEHAMAAGVAPILTGKASKDLRLQLEKVPGNGRERALCWFSKFFMHPGGPDNLWDLVSVALGQDESMLPESYSKGIMHMKHLVKYKAAEAQELEMSRIMSKFGGGLGGPSKDDRLNTAASLHIRLGNTQRYCELMVELGNWEKALAVAPSVSLEYWKSLTERMAQYLLGEDSDDTIPYCVAAGNAAMLVQFFTQRGQLSDALIAAAAAYEGNINPPTKAKHRSKSQSNGITEDENNIRLLYRTSEDLADWYFRNGSPALAACCHLAVEDQQKAMAKLVRGHELELAACIGQVLTNVPELTHLAIEFLARRCEKIGRWDLALDLLKTIPDAGVPMAKLCARCAASMAEINDLHAKAGLPSVEECLVEAERLHKKDVFSAVKFYLLSTSPELGLELGLRAVKARVSEARWQADDVFDLLQLMGCIQTEKLQQHKFGRLRAELLPLCSYVGALVAIRRQYNSIVPALFRHTKFLMEREPSDIPLTVSLLDSEVEGWQAYIALSESRASSPRRPETRLRVEQQAILEDLLAKVGRESCPVGVGPDIVAGSQLPSHSDVHHSYLTGQRIQGPAFFLEDGRSAISISDAIMWAKVNPFSPLGSAVRINPF